MAEPTPETITLPKSGLVLYCGGTDDLLWYAEALCAPFTLYCDFGKFRGNSCGQHRYGTEADCLEWLDDRAMELRSALLPPGAIVVADTEETVERIARALPLKKFDDLSDWAKDRYIIDSRAVLAALREAAR